MQAGQGVQAISIHALREEGDRDGHTGDNPARVFLSTPSARRATIKNQPFCLKLIISIHALREEGDAGRANGGDTTLGISIHALREEGDAAAVDDLRTLPNFYPRPPRGGRRQSLCRGVQVCSISIHALREEGDRRKSDRLASIQQISIHALREEGDPSYNIRGLGVRIFLSTPSARRATLRQHGRAAVSGISIHALREEGDRGGI